MRDHRDRKASRRQAISFEVPFEFTFHDTHVASLPFSSLLSYMGKSKGAWLLMHKLHGFGKEAPNLPNVTEKMLCFQRPQLRYVMC